MSAERVLDASVAVAIFFEEARSPSARLAVSGAARLIAPPLILVEFANVCSKKLKTKHITQSVAIEALRALAGMIRVIDEGVEGTERAMTLSAERAFSTFDAHYLALARSRDAPMLTADLRIVRQAQANGMTHLVQAVE